MHDTFITEVRNLLEYKAPKVYVPKLILLDVGHLLLIMDRSVDCIGQGICVTNGVARGTRQGKQELKNRAWG